MLKAEVVKMYEDNMTPEKFMIRIIPLLDALEDSYRAETMSEHDLEEILVTSKTNKNNQTPNSHCFYDVVDLSMYRAN
jgi:hypothetical protein